MPTMYTPANLRAVTDFSEFYEKPPHEMSRYELNELEKIIRIEDGIDQEEVDLAPSVDSEGNVVDKLEEFKKTDYYFTNREQIKKIQPMRIGIFKRYWDRFKFNKRRRELLCEMFDETDKQVEFYLDEEFVSWKDEIEGSRQFLEDIYKKKIDDDVRLSLKGNTVIRTLKGKTQDLNMQEIEYSVKTFNPFDKLNIKTQEGKIQKTYIERENLDDPSSGLTLGTTPTEESGASTSEGSKVEHRSPTKKTTKHK